MPVVALRPVVDELSDDEGISLQTAAALIGCSVKTVRRLIETAYLDAWRIGPAPNSTIRVRLGSVRRYKLDRVVVPLDERREAHKPPPARVRSASQREALRYIDQMAKRRR